MAEETITAADVAYVEANYFTLGQLCVGRAETPAAVKRLIAGGVLPAPSYVLDDGTEWFPADHFVLVDQAGGTDVLRSHFESRHEAAGGDPVVREADWEGCLSGLYGVCLRQVSPETMVRKTQLVESLTALLAKPERDSGEWRAQLRRQVWELDALEREFSPDYDRVRFNELPTRDR